MRPSSNTKSRCAQEDLAVRMTLDAVNADATVVPTTEFVLLASDTKCNNQVATKETITGNELNKHT